MIALPRTRSAATNTTVKRPIALARKTVRRDMQNSSNFQKTLGRILAVGPFRQLQLQDVNRRFKYDPSSASNFDPLERRGLAIALVASELAGIAGAR